MYMNGYISLLIYFITCNLPRIYKQNNQKVSNHLRGLRVALGGGPLEVMRLKAKLTEKIEFCLLLKLSSIAYLYGTYSVYINNISLYHFCR